MKMMRQGLVAALVALAPVCAKGATLVPPGNTAAEQPAIPNASANRTRALRTSFENKYQRVLALLRNDKRLIADIKKVSAQFGIDPIHMVGAIVGEHTYNVDALDRAQSYYVKAVAYLQGDISFSHDGETVDAFVKRPQFETCNGLSGSLETWNCREAVWEKTFRGKSVDGKAFPDNRFSAVFFQPFYAGQTFGIGQMNPLTALKMTDRVSRVTGARALDATDGKSVYRAIMDPRETLPYIAATLASSIDAYKKVAGFDISANPGLSATLYNTGNAELRAAALAAENRKRKAEGKPARLPEVNYYGWLINDKEAELRSLL